jgi:hypothetical protein
VSLGSISVANASMVKDTFSATINSSNVSGFTAGQAVNFSVTYDNASFSDVTFSNGYERTFLNPLFDFGSFASLFSTTATKSYSFLSSVFGEKFQASISEGGRELQVSSDIVMSYSSGFGPFSTNIYTGTPTYSQTAILPPVPPTQIPDVTPTDVPEPETLAMMLLGLPMMAWTARRRKKV